MLKEMAKTKGKFKFFIRGKSDTNKYIKNYVWYYNNITFLKSIDKKDKNT